MKRKILCIYIITTLLIIQTLLVYAVPNNYHTSIEKEQFIGTYKDGPVEEWNLTFGTEKFDAFLGVEQTNDGGIVAIGTTDGRGYYNGGDFFLVKTNNEGVLEWQKTYGGTKTDWGNSVKQTDDGGYIVLGSTASYGSGQWDIWVVKTNEHGDEEWNTTYGGTGFEQSGHSIVETSDNCFFVIGLTSSHSDDYTEDAVLLKLDQYGNEIWNKTYETGNDEHFWDIELNSDNGIILAGFNKNSTVHNAWIVKTDMDGNLIWEKKYGPANQALDIVETDDGGYIFVAEAEGSCFSGYLNSWLMKIDNMGNLEWDKLFITPIGEDNFAVHHHILKHDNGGYVLAGVANGVKPVYSVGDLWLTQVDEYGHVLWEKILGGQAYESTYRLDITNDGGYIVAGSTKSYGQGNFDAWLVKISDFENQRPKKPVKPTGPSSGKPDREYIFSTSTTDPDGGSLQYMWDWGDGNFSEWLDINEATYTWTTEDNFEVRVIAMDEDGGESDWSDPLSFSTPKNKLYINPVFLRFLENHLRMFPLMRFLLKLNRGI